MEGYYNGEISKNDIKDFFMEYCSVMLYKVSSEKEEYYEDYNKFLNKLIVTRIWGDSPIVVENRQ